jgi:hypothetical protein
MRKPRGRGTSADSKRSIDATAGLARPRAAAQASAERREPAPAKPRAGTARTAGSTVQPRRAKAALSAVQRAAAEQPASPRRRTGKAGAVDAVRRSPREAPRAADVAVVSEATAPLPPPRPPELDWDDTPGASARDGRAVRWAARGEELFQQLAQHGADRHEYRADLKDGRFVWLAPSGRVSVEARAQVLCSWSRVTAAVAMAWADPLVRSAGVRRIDGMLAEIDDVDEEGAWRIAMEAADASGSAYLYRVPAPHAWYFLGLSELTFAPKRASFDPGAPVGLVLRAIGEARDAIESRAEPASIVRNRLRVLGSSLFHQAKYAYRSTDWVARLDRTGSRLMHLSKRIPREGFGAVAAGQQVREWIERDLAVELIEALGLIEDEWSSFS